MRYDTIVVGAGAAGTAVAQELARDREHQVLLLEAGAPKKSPDDWYTIVGDSDEIWPRRRVRRSAWTDPAQYPSGLGLGGSARINGMLALPGLPSDFNSWAAEFHAPSWTWAAVAPIVTDLTKRSSMPTKAQLSPLDIAMYRAAAEIGIDTDAQLALGDSGAGVIGISHDQDGRTLSAEALQPGRQLPKNLTVICDDAVTGFTSGTPMRVYCGNGHEYEANQVVLTAGVLGTPALLQRAGVQRLGIGRNFRDHASIAIPLQMRHDGPAAYWMDMAIRLDARQPGDAMLLPFYRPDSRADGGAEAFLLAAAMCCDSAGEIIEDSTGQVCVEARQLTSSADIEAMDVALDTACALIARISDIAVPTDEELMSVLRGSAGVARINALSGYPGRLFHGCGTARVGRSDDPHAVVDENGKVFGWDRLYVMDASILPRVPRAPTHVSTSVIATHLARRLRLGQVATD
ncbi:MAG: GMC oxidoreductase [Antricoccus sp.]